MVSWSIACLTMEYGDADLSSRSGVENDKNVLPEKHN